MRPFHLRADRSLRPIRRVSSLGEDAGLFIGGYAKIVLPHKAF
jgi:hypothetical protein